MHPHVVRRAEPELAVAPRPAATAVTREVMVVPGREASDDLEPGTRIGEWTIERQIGSGGMGTVYAAVHTVIGKRAAIKVVRDSLGASRRTVGRFLQEARVVNEIGHPNIVDIFQLGCLDDGRPYLVMELLCGRTLAQRLEAGPVLLDEAVEILGQICAALGAAHAHGVIHRDLKPENIVLVEGPALLVKLVDWGIAKRLDDPRSFSTLDEGGMMVGTPRYIAPEQARCQEVDGRADVYALGAISYEIFLGRPPFAADNVAELVAMHLRELPPPPSALWPEIPEALERMILAMLAKAPSARPSIRAIQETLAELVAAGRSAHA